MKKSTSFCLFLCWDKEWILWVESRDTYEEDQDLEATFSAKCWTASMENETEVEDGVVSEQYSFVSLLCCGWFILSVLFSMSALSLSCILSATMACIS